MRHTLVMAAQALLAHRLRSFLTAFGIMIGVGTVVTIQGVVEGLNRAFQDQISTVGTGTLYVSRRPWVVFSNWWRYRSRPRLTQNHADCLRERLRYADSVVPFVHRPSTVVAGNSQLIGIRVIGSTGDWDDMSGIEPVRGRFLSLAEVESGQAVVAVGADLVPVLKREGIDLEDRITIAGESYRVVGEMPGRGSTFGMSQDEYVVIPLSRYQRRLGSRQSLTIGVLADPALIVRAEDELIGQTRICRGLGPAQENNFAVNSQELLLEVYETLTRSLYATALGLGFLTLVVGGVGIMNIMLVAVRERTREIGIRKALGAKPRAILTQFLSEAAMVSGLGGFLGALAGGVGARLIARFTPVPATVPFEVVLFGIAFGVVVGVLFGFLPAYRAARMTPVDALRNE